MANVQTQLLQRLVHSAQAWPTYRLLDVQTPYLHDPRLERRPCCCCIGGQCDGHFRCHHIPVFTVQLDI